MWFKPKRFLFFLFAFASDLYHPCFSKFFKLFLCEKKCFLGVFVTYFMSKLSREFKGVFGSLISITHNSVFITYNSKMVEPIAKRLFGKSITLFLSLNYLIFEL